MTSGSIVLQLVFKDCPGIVKPPHYISCTKYFQYTIKYYQLSVQQKIQKVVIDRHLIFFLFNIFTTYPSLSAKIY